MWNIVSQHIRFSYIILRLVQWCLGIQVWFTFLIATLFIIGSDFVLVQNDTGVLQDVQSRPTQSTSDQFVEPEKVIPFPPLSKKEALKDHKRKSSYGDWFAIQTWIGAIIE